MTGTIALQGGGPFIANDELDARLLASVGATGVVMLPTADAFERPERLVADRAVRRGRHGSRHAVPAGGATPSILNRPDRFGFLRARV